MIYLKNKEIKLIYALSLLIAISQILIYVFQPIIPIFSVLILFLSYYVLIKYNNLFIIIILILSARIINGFIVPNNIIFYKLTIFCTFYFPFLLYILINVKNLAFIKKRISSKFKFFFIFLFFLILSFIFNLPKSSDLLFKRIIPPIYFAIAILFYSDKIKNINLFHITIYFRLIFITSLITYLLPNYIETNNFLYKEGTIFGEANDIPFIDYFNLIRNQGIFFDGRILGIFVYIYFYILIQKKKNINLLEVCLLFAVSLSTVSRGGIIVFIFLLILFIYFRVNKNFKIGLIIISIITFIIIGFGNVSISLNNNLVDFTSTFDIFSNDNSKKNVLSQRQIFSDYALSAFEKKPILGEGVGNLTSKKADLNVEIDSGAGIVSYNVVTDAFIFSLLGEMGILGMILFLLAFSEIIIIKNNIFSYGMFVGVIIHLIGTDIPDIFMPYFVVLFLFSYVKLSNNNKLRYKSNY